MTLPLDIRFRNLRPSPLVEDDIRRRAAKLHTLCDAMTSCHVLVEVPHRHHEKGNRFHVRIDIAVPGTEIAVTRESNLNASASDEEAWAKALEVDAMRTNLQLVVREAFDVAKRRVEEYAERRRHEVKTHERGSSGLLRAT